MWKILLMLMILINSVISFSNIKDGIYTGEFTENGIYNVTIIINTLNSDTKEVGYWYTYEYRISEIQEIYYLKMTKNKSTGEYTGTNGLIVVKLKENQKNSNSVDLTDKSINSLWTLKLKKEITNSESKLFFEIFKDLNNRGFLENKILN